MKGRAGAKFSGPCILAISSRCSLMARARSGSAGEALPPLSPLLGVAKSSSAGMGFKCPSAPYKNHMIMTNMYSWSTPLQ